MPVDVKHEFWNDSRHAFEFIIMMVGSGALIAGSHLPFFGVASRRGGVNCHADRALPPPKAHGTVSARSAHLATPQKPKVSPG